MRHHLLLSVFLLSVVCGRAAYGCGSGNTSTSGTFCNTGTLTLGNGNGPTQSSAYPISVSGLSGAVSSVNVTLNGFTHPYPYEVNLILVAPNGNQALTILGGDCGGGGGTPPNNLTMTLADTGSAFPPNGSFNSTCTATTYKPYVNEAYATGNAGVCSSSLYSSPAPTSAPCANNPSGSNTFTSVFTGTSPNGTWNIYAYDYGADQGSISGVTLTITTEVTQSATTTSLSLSSNEIFNSLPNDESTFTATVTSGGNTVNEGVVQFYDNGTAAGSVQLVNSSGQATYQATYSSGAAEGLHSITATYTDTASNPKYETSNNNANPASLFIDNHTLVTNNGTTFCNSGSVTVPPSGTTSPYPQHVFVNGLSGSLAGITLTLNNITEVNGLSDWKVLLVGPDGTSFAPMVYAGGEGTHAGASGLTFNLSDAGSTLLAMDTSNTAPTNNGTYLPTAYGTYTWPTQNEGTFAPPQSGYGYPQTQGSARFNTTFASENLNNPSKPWSLYISDQAGDSDVIGGYCLTFAVNSGLSTSTSVSANPNPAITNTQVALTAHVTANGGTTNVTSGSVSFEQQGNPTPLGSGTLDGNGNASITFTPSVEGQYTITAIYGGQSGSYNQSQGSGTLQVDNQTTTTNNGNNNYSFCNPGPITITSSTNHTPQQYPSRVLVNNLAGVVQSLSLTLDSLSYSYSSDLAMMLAGPNASDNLVFWGNIGSSGAITNQNFTILDGRPTLPQSTTPSGGAYAPTAYSSPVTLTFAAPASASPNLAAPAGTATLSGQFANTSPNGYWSFFAEEETAGGDTGSIGQHCVNITVTPPVLQLTKSHSGSFTQGDSADTYTVVVTNQGPGSTAGALTLTDTLPSGLTAMSMSETNHTGGGSGSDWSCTAATATCTRTSVMPSGESDTITLTVSVGYSSATGTNAVTNSVTVSGGGISTAQTATDKTTINTGPGYALNITTNPSGAGTVSVSPTNGTGMSNQHYAPQTTVTLAATPASGYAFLNWSGSQDLANTTSDTTTITMNSSSESVTANFVTASVGGNGFFYNKIKKQGTATYTITNTSAATLGPVQFVLYGLPAGVTAANNTGTWNGNPYWTVPGGSIAPAGSGQVSVTLNYNSGTNFATNGWVISGSLQ